MSDQFSQEEIEEQLAELNAKKRQAAKDEREARKAERAEDMLAAAEQFVRENPYHYITKIDRYVRQVGNQWYFLKPSALRLMHSVFTENDFWKAFQIVMESERRNHYDCTYSFKNYPHTLNMLNIDNWIQPIAGQHHWIFDVLMQSLGSGKAENIEHLERVIAYKYMYPECYVLPCLLIYGEGGVGKNLLVDKVLGKLFADQTVSSTSDNIVSTFNSLIRGKVAVLINETVVGKHDNAKLTNLLGKERLTINEKGIPQYDVDNTPLYFIGSNDWSGGALLDRSEADRRLSVLRCERGKTLPFWIAKHENTDIMQAKQWMISDGISILSDEKQIGRWIDHLIAKYANQSQPMALHGADYNVLLRIQEGVEERVARAVFLAPYFTHIRVKDLYECYTIACRETGNRYVMTDTKFHTRIKGWLEVNAPHIEKNESKINYYETHPIKKTRERHQKVRTIWLNTNYSLSLQEKHEDNHLDYYQGTGATATLSIELD